MACFLLCFAWSSTAAGDFMADGPDTTDEAGSARPKEPAGSADGSDAQRPEIRVNRRTLFASVAMAVGLVASYGMLAVQGALFILPKNLAPKTRKLFIGHSKAFTEGMVRTVRDLEGTPVMIKRTASGFRAFSSVCPHLGCRVHWQDDESQFFCPCHNGVFDPEGRAVSGPPADAGQSLGDVPIEVDTASGALFLRVKAPERRNT